MSFAGVSVIANGELLGDGVGGHRWRILYHRVRDSGSDSNSDHDSYSDGDRYSDYDSDSDSGSDSDNIVLRLRLRRGAPVKAEVNFTFVGTENQDSPVFISGSKIMNFRKRGDSCREKITGEELEEHLMRDCFTVRCDIVIINTGATTTTSSPVITMPPSDMQQNFIDLLRAGEGTDVVFQVGTETIAAHRCVLAARSSVFRAALFGPMTEGSSMIPVVQIEDMDAAVFQAMLSFIYGDTLPALKDEIKDMDVALLQHLLVAADRYDLRRLILMCERKLCEHINVGTVTSNLAEQHGCDELKNACCAFLRYPDNLMAAVDTHGFDDRSCPPVMKEMILRMLPSK
ncbi:BTB/POZ and MATH domain-containing protein 2-like [Triticum dicoccoides]|uniref:BTB/POZ and MATH domain-containing protein 2-like n=1 Tax=Triticum dicoccoides TaxID=85692 RepID=UPI001890D493|nr:BTB/POZ and MATH domain-containing protein 2-like [Triticum dicoccoides]